MTENDRNYEELLVRLAAMDEACKPPAQPTHVILAAATQVVATLDRLPADYVPSNDRPMPGWVREFAGKVIAEAGERLSKGKPAGQA